jgi:hypothetical protein
MANHRVFILLLRGVRGDVGFPDLTSHIISK